MSLMYSTKNSKKTEKVENRTNRAKMFGEQIISNLMLMSLMYSTKNSKKTEKVENRTNRAKMLNKRCIKLKQDLTVLTQG